MLSEKPWRAEALVRLFASVLICSIFLSAIALSLVEFFASVARQNPWSFVGFTSIAVTLLITALVLLSKTWPIERLARNLALLMLCVYGSFLFTWLAARTQGSFSIVPKSTVAQIVIGMACFQGAALLLTRLLLRAHQTNWRESFGLNHRPWRAIFLGCCAVPVGIIVQFAFSEFMKALGVDTQEQEAVQLLRSAHGIGERIVMGIAAILVAPVGEEILFRGLLYPAIKQAGFPRTAIWITSLLFAAIHVNLTIFIPLTLLALMLVWLYEKMDNLLAPIAAHSLFNATNFILLFTVDSLSHKLPPG